ncbi:MAG: hypothetical protein IJQ12_00990 [Lachnospiraceae bacterium]|nr:hypothetical protein [Lachnospiraceae bacterium]
MNTRPQRRAADYGGLAVCAGLFVCVYLIVSFKLHNDSPQYIAMHIHREPVYPLYLAFFRVIFGEGDRYLWAAGFVQCLLNALGIWYFAERVTRVMWGTLPLKIAAYVLALLPQPLTYVSSVTRFYMAGDICSESIAYPLFLVCFVQLLLLLLSPVPEDGKKDFARCIRCALLLLLASLVRGQMTILFIVFFAVLLVRALRGGLGGSAFLLKGILLPFLSMLLLMGARNLSVKTYFYALGNGFETYSIAAGNAFSDVLYVSDRTDGAFIPETYPLPEGPRITLREYFYRMYDKMDEMRMNRRYESGSFHERNLFLETCNDPLKYEVGERVVYESTRPLGFDYNEENLMQGRVFSALLRALLPHLFGAWLSVYLRHVFQGLVRSVGIAHPVLSYVFFALLLAVMLFTIARALRGLSRKERITDGTWMMLLVLLITAGNVFAVALVQFCISRYMFYVFPLFYLALLYLAREVRTKGNEA